jgi:hypothetical protein
MHYVDPCLFPSPLLRTLVLFSPSFLQYPELLLRWPLPLLSPSRNRRRNIQFQSRTEQYSGADESCYPSVNHDDSLSN